MLTKIETDILNYMDIKQDEQNIYFKCLMSETKRAEHLENSDHIKMFVMHKVL